MIILIRKCPILSIITKIEKYMKKIAQNRS